MKKLLFFLFPIILAGCGKIVTPITPPDISDLVDCHQGAGIFQTYIEKNTPFSNNTWMVDTELFYAPSIQSCIGKCIIIRKEGSKDDISIFIIRNISKNQDIYFQSYQGNDLKKEYEGQKKYREYISQLQGK